MSGDLCAFCEGPLPPGRPRIYCSKRCRQSADWQRKKGRSEALSSGERSKQAALAENLGWHSVDRSPDSRSAVRLRRELERDRRLGLAFEDIWLEEVDYVTSRLIGDEPEQWRAAFLATESAWRSAYDRTAASVSSLQSDLLLDAVA